MLEPTFEQAHPLARRAAQVRAGAFVLTAAIPAFERADIEQEIYLACWRALPQFNPNRASLRTFVEHVVTSHLISLHRARRCRPRLQPLEDDQQPAADAWTCEIELRTDVQRILDALPQLDRQLALLLVEHTPTEVSRIIGIARSTVYERIRHIRIAFADAGLRPRSSDDGDRRRR